MTEKWKNIVGILPIASILTVGLGYIFLHFYYSLIGINIFFYISTSEILLSFIPILPSIITISIAVTTSLIFMFAIENYSDQEIEKNKNKFIKIVLHIISFGVIYILFQVYTYLPSLENSSLQIILSIFILAIVAVTLMMNKSILSNFVI